MLDASTYCERPPDDHEDREDPPLEHVGEVRPFTELWRRYRNRDVTLRRRCFDEIDVDRRNLSRQLFCQTLDVDPLNLRQLTFGIGEATKSSRLGGSESPGDPDHARRRSRNVDAERYETSVDEDQPAVVLESKRGDDVDPGRTALRGIDPEDLLARKIRADQRDEAPLDVFGITGELDNLPEGLRRHVLARFDRCIEVASLLETVVLPETEIDHDRDHRDAEQVEGQPSGADQKPKH